MATPIMSKSQGASAQPRQDQGPWSTLQRAGENRRVTTQVDESLHPGHRPGVPTMVLLEGVSRRYLVGDNEVYALRDVDLEVDQGEFAVVLGPSGSGKSTLLNMISALDSPTSGRATVAGQEITGMDRADLFRFRREVVSFVFQTFNLFPTLTALENVQCGGEIAGSARDSRRRAAKVLDQVGLGDRLHHYPSELSGGEQQRVAVARALVTDNPIVVADEPTGDLDFRTGVQILELLEEQTAAGRTVVAVTHNREISRVADRVIELSSGRIVSDGPPEGGRAPIGDLRW
jgi:putative ABC transport system ATP-binding protein